jgi:hypothetical protein
VKQNEEREVMHEGCLACRLDFVSVAADREEEVGWAYIPVMNMLQVGEYWGRVNKRLGRRSKQVSTNME